MVTERQTQTNNVYKVLVILGILGVGMLGWGG